MKDRETKSYESVSRENLPAILQDIGSQREKQGSSEVLIPRIRRIRQQAQNLGDTSAVVQLLQEEFLSGQHMVMEEKANGFRANPIRIAKGVITMETSSRSMEKFLSENNESLDPTVKARIYRFLGRYAEHMFQLSKAEYYYSQGLNHFNKTTSPEDRANRLELLGFLAHLLLKQGKVQNGINLTVKTLQDFDETPEGIWLKDNDYQRWAIWKSGILIRTAERLSGRKKVNGTMELVKNLLEEAETILRNKDNSTSGFDIRLAELKTAKAAVTPRK